MGWRNCDTPAGDNRENVIDAMAQRGNSLIGFTPAFDGNGTRVRDELIFHRLDERGNRIVTRVSPRE